jgi:type 1 fimbria pilin
MIKFSGLSVKRAAGFLSALLLFAAVCSGTVPVSADGGIAMSGSFYQQSFEIPQGSEISGPDIYVVVFNTGSEEIEVRMTTQAPDGVHIVLSQTDFTLEPSGNLQIPVSVEVDEDAVPGSYDINITAEAYKRDTVGIQLAGAAGQTAALTVLGESGTVILQATSPDSSPITANVRLFRVADAKNREVAYSDTGSLEVKVAPGSFYAVSYIGGINLAEEYFDIASGVRPKRLPYRALRSISRVSISLQNYNESDEKLAFFQIVYTVKNLYQRISEGQVILTVKRGGVLLPEVVMATLSPLDTGRVGLNYNYIPSGKWEAGDYEFQLILKLNGQQYTTSSVQNLAVSAAVAGIAAFFSSINPYVWLPSAGITVYIVFYSQDGCQGARSGEDRADKLRLCTGLLVCWHFRYLLLQEIPPAAALLLRWRYELSVNSTASRSYCSMGYNGNSEFAGLFRYTFKPATEFYAFYTRVDASRYKSTA